MSKYRYKGDTPFAEQAASELGLAITPAELRGLKPYNVLTSLVSQAGSNDHEDAAARGILDAARKHLDVLRVALRTAELILADADAAFEPEPEAEVIPVVQAEVIPVVQAEVIPVVPTPEPEQGSEAEGSAGEAESEAESTDAGAAETPAEPGEPKPRRGRKPKPTEG